MREELKLIKPNDSFKNEYLDMIKDWKKGEEKIIPWSLNLDTTDFHLMVENLDGYSKGKGLEDGFVECSTYWLVNKSNKVLGAIDIRHRINENLLYKGGYMPSVGALKTDIKTLSEFALQDLFDFIGEIMTLNSLTRNLPNDCRESRFAKGEVCPHCNSTHVVKNGKLNGKQRYKCRGCNKTFNDFSKSALSYTKLSLEKWIEYAKCMVIGYSIRKSAEIVEVGVKTSFYMRHKILDCIGEFMGTGDVDGVVEMDETFVAESFKGNHKKSGFLMPRHSRKRGKEIKKRGISNEQICVATAIDRNNNIILEMICKGRVGFKDLERLYDGHIDHDSIICTDSHKSYIRFGRNLNLEHKRIMRNHYKNGIYHINHVNSLHSQFKKWMDKFNGVSTKFLANYLHWFKWLQYFKDDKDIIKSK